MLANHTLCGYVRLLKLGKEHLDGRIIGHPQGKVLGGTSAINAQAWIPPSASDVDAWEKLGNNGWNYQMLKPYLDKCFTVTRPDNATAEHLQLSWLPANLSKFSGLVYASFAGTKEDPLGKAWVETFGNLRHPLTSDPFDGKSIGAYNGLSTIDARNKTRSYSNNAYYLPVMERANLHLLSGCTVTRIFFDTAGDGCGLRASGVEYLQNGTLNVVNATEEIILSAGVFQSPKILELSGVGNPDILESKGIEVKLDNPYVGTNLQDHLLGGISFEAKDGIYTGDDLLRGDPATIEAAMTAYQVNKTGPFASSGISSFAYLPPADFDNGNNSDVRNEMLNTLSEKQGTHPLDVLRYSQLHDLLSNLDEGTSQYFLFAAQSNVAGRNTTGSISDGLLPGNFITLGSALSHPLSTGNVHISSSDPVAKPTIDHKYLSDPLDLELHARQLRYLERIAAAEPMASLLKPGGQRNHPAAFIGEDLDKAKIFAAVGGTSNWHSVGTCAMAPKESGGVVDTNFNVYGVEGLRVVDASVFPLVLQSNLQCMVYAVAERAADLIKESLRDSN
jgi:choline dehydrogenase-like flavoprotein